MSTCTLTMESLSSPAWCESNLSGVKSLYLVPKDNVTAVNATKAASMTTFDTFVEIGASLGESQAVVTATGTGKGFMKLYTKKGMGELKYTMQGSGTGNHSLKATLEVFHPAAKKKIIGFLATMMNQELIVVAGLNNGEFHLLGDLDRGATLADGVELTSGKAVTDDSGLTLQIEWDCFLPQIFADGWDPTDATNGITIES